MPAEYIAILMFGSMLTLMLTGQRMFGVIGFVAVVGAIWLWGDRGGYDLAFAQTFKVMGWFPLITLPMFIFMGYVLSESRLIAGQRADQAGQPVPVVDALDAASLGH